MNASAADFQAINDARKDEWLIATALWPFGYPRREYRADRLAKLRLIQSKSVGGDIIRYFVASANLQKE